MTHAAIASTAPRRRRWGQHFLRDANTLRRIVDAIDPRPGEYMVEIGAGDGALTHLLLQRLGRLHAVEKDRRLAQRLVERYSPTDGLNVHRADALSFDFCRLAPIGGSSLRLAGNLPYSISTPLLFRLRAQRDCIADMVFLLQSELVERLVARPGESEYGRLSLTMGAWCHVQRLFQVPPHVFSPPPRVHSTLVRLVPMSEPAIPVEDEAWFAELVRCAFTRRRKILRNALAGLLTEEDLKTASLSPLARPQTLSLEEFARLAALARQRGQADCPKPGGPAPSSRRLVKYAG